MNLLRHLLRYGGLYLVASLLYGAICRVAYAGPPHYGWPGVIGLHLLVGVAAWACYGFHKALNAVDL